MVLVVVGIVVVVVVLVLVVVLLLVVVDGAGLVVAVAVVVGPESPSGGMVVLVVVSVVDVVDVGVVDVVEVDVKEVDVEEVDVEDVVVVVDSSGNKSSMVTGGHIPPVSWGVARAIPAKASTNNAAVRGPRRVRTRPLSVVKACTLFPIPPARLPDPPSVGGLGGTPAGK